MQAAQLTVATSAPVERAFLRVDHGSVAVAPDDDRLLHVATAPGEVPQVTLLTRDGHVVRAAVAAGASVRATRDPASVLVGRGLLMTALLILGGAAGTTLLVVDPALRSPIRRIGIPTDRAVGEPAESALGPGAWRLGALAACAAGALGVGLVIVGTLNALGSWDVGMLLSDTRLGHVMDVALLALVATALVWAPGRAPTVARLGLTGALCTVALLAISFGGHATAGTDAMLGGAFDTAHMVATALWLGGLVVLLANLPRLNAAREGEQAHGVLAAMVVRFSSLAIACVATLVVTGVYRALAELRGLGDLIDTGYGRVLTVKLALFALMLGVAAVNRLVLHPRLERAAIGLTDSDRGAARALRRSVRVEIMMAAAVLVVVAVLVALPPP